MPLSLLLIFYEMLTKKTKTKYIIMSKGMIYWFTVASLTVEGNNFTQCILDHRRKPTPETYHTVKNSRFDDSCVKG